MVPSKLYTSQGFASLFPVLLKIWVGHPLLETAQFEKSSSLHLSAELNCGISLEVESLFSQRCDFWLFFFFWQIDRL